MSAVIAPNNGYDIYTGFWVDWAYGRIQGSTLTLTRQQGGLLIAFLALFVTATGTSFWRITCFFLHTFLTSEEPQDGLYHQRQAIIRNAESPAGALFGLLNINLLWRKRARRPFRRLVPFALAALIVYGGFAVAGIFSSNVTTNTANEVLLRGKACGILPNVPTDEASAATDPLWQTYFAERVTAYSNYALQCYSSNQTSGTQACQPFIKPRLRYSVDANASCPFSDDMCILKSDNLVLDSGFLDSHLDFGVNIPKNNRFLYREYHSCAPITTDGYSRPHNNSKVPIPAMRYYYGETALWPSNNSNLNIGFTYEVPMNISAPSLDNWTDFQAPAADYSIGRQSWYGNDDASTTFHPIPQLRPTDADLMLLFLSAPGIKYSDPVNDPWYSAHTPQGHWFNEVTGEMKDDYIQDEPARVLACTTQYQFCNPSLPQSSRCEPLGSGDQTAAGIDTTIWRTKGEQESVTWAKRIIATSRTVLSFGSPFATAGVSALSSRNTLVRGAHLFLAPNQWQLDMEHTFETTLASLQASFVETVTGPSNADLNKYKQAPKDTASHQMCNSQKIVSSLYYSFNVLGMAIILILGGLTMMLDLTLETIVTWIDKRRRHQKHKYALLEWHTNSTLQLQRLAHEELGLGTWSRTTEKVPTTRFGEVLGILDITDDKHPHLSRPTGSRCSTKDSLSSDSIGKPAFRHIEEVPTWSSDLVSKVEGDRTVR